jgi:DNA polymerase III delta subunit
MLYVILGTDRVTSRAKFASLRDTLMRKRFDASVSVFDADTFDVRSLGALVGGVGLFGDKALVVLDGILGDERTRKDCIDALPDIVASENVFLLYEEKVDATTKKALEKYAEKIEVYDMPKQSSRSPMPKSASFLSERGRMCAEFNPFHLADAVGARDRKRAWVLLSKARMCDIAGEELHGTLFWQIKVMILAKHARTADEAGLKPFVFSKAKHVSAQIPDEELLSMSRNLVHMYHDAHRGGAPLHDALEEYVLSL